MSDEMFCPKCTETFPSGVAFCPNDGTKLHALTDDDLTGQTLDEKYLIKDRLGEGGMGVVYLAEHKMLCKDVALKVIRRELVVGKTGVKRFLTEARATASLSSPNTVTLHDFGVTPDGVVYYTMELLKGISLARQLKKTGKIPWKSGISIVLQVCHSLAEAHRNGIIHRDIKPDNIYLAQRDGETVVKVLDFGLAKLVSGNTTETLTKTGTVCGTPQYLSPEQAQGKAVGPASDIYSLGIVLFEMLAGRPPYTGDTPIGIMHQHIMARPPAIADVAAETDVPSALEQVLVKTLAKDPTERFASANDLASALSAVSRQPSSTRSVGVVKDLTTSFGAVETVTRAYESGAAEERELAVAGTAVAEEALEQGSTPPTPNRNTFELQAEDGSEPVGSASLEELPEFSSSSKLLWVVFVGVAILAAVLAVWGLGRNGALLDGPDGSALQRDVHGMAHALDATTQADTGRDAAIPSTSPTDSYDSIAQVPDLPQEESPPDSVSGPEPELAKPESESAPLWPPEGMAEIPKGTYPVGCQPDDHGCFDDEPAKLVELGSFAIDRTETTVLAYKECVDAGRCPVPGKGAGCNWGAVGSEDHPVNCIDWTSAAAYCGSVGKRLALGVEWEVAARGLAHPDYPWGDTAPSCDIAAIASDSKDDCSLRGTLPVGRKPRDRSWAGVMDLGGNVREWVSDPYGTDATGSSQERVNRGGSWQMSAGKLFTAHTIGADRFSVKRPDLGVRCAVSKGEDGSD